MTNTLNDEIIIAYNQAEHAVHSVQGLIKGPGLEWRPDRSV